MAKAAACWPLGWADDCAGTQLGGSWANSYFMKKAASAGGLARQITRVLRAALLYAKHGMYFTDGEPACG